MNKHIAWPLIIFTAILSGCTNAENKLLPAKANQEEEIIIEKTPVSNRTENVYDIPTIKTLFVINRKGTQLYEKADKSSTVLAELNFGDRIEIIGESENWYQIKERIGRSFTRNGSIIESTGWEIVNISKVNAGTINQIQLSSQDLYQTTDEAQVKGKLKIDLMSEEYFNKTKREQVDFLVKEPNLIQVKDSILTISLSNGQKKKYVSTPNAEETKTVYTYQGHIDLLQAYLLSLDYYEGGECKLFNALNGKEISSIIDNPFISPNGKYLASMYTDPYDNDTDFELYTIGANQRINLIFQASFKNWMVALEPQEIHWIDNSTFAVAVLHSNAFWNANGDLNKNYQYLKIKVL